MYSNHQVGTKKRVQKGKRGFSFEFYKRKRVGKDFMKIAIVHPVRCQTNKEKIMPARGAKQHGGVGG